MFILQEWVKPVLIPAYLRLMKESNGFNYVAANPSVIARDERTRELQRGEVLYVPIDDFIEVAEGYRGDHADG